MDRFELYERTVQAPEHLIPFLVGLHGASPRVLGEDFCGTALLARRWGSLVPGGQAVAVDLDREALKRVGNAPGVTLFEADLRRPLQAELPQPDVVWVGNFSIGYLHERAELIGYLARTRARLARGGVFACDTYGGGAAWRTGAAVREHFLPGGLRVRSTWEQRSADPVTAHVQNVLSFRVDRDGDVVFEAPEAFVYDWRVWSLPELADAAREARFASSNVYAHLANDAEARVGRPRQVREAGDLGDPGERWAAVFAARG
jgi:SAM-dependent methyltransferase